jgi:hypothetical protein
LPTGEESEEVGVGREEVISCATGLPVVIGGKDREQADVFQGCCDLKRNDRSDQGRVGNQTVNGFDQIANGLMMYVSIEDIRS